MAANDNILQKLFQLIGGNVGALDQQAPQPQPASQWAKGGAPGETDPTAAIMQAALKAQIMRASQLQRKGEQEFAGMQINPWMPQPAYDQAYKNHRFPWQRSKKP